MIAISRLDVVSARSLPEALDALAARPGHYTVLAGGTDVMVYLDARTIAPRAMLDVWRVGELRYVRADDGAVAIGALATYTDLIRSPLVAEHAPELCACALEVGAAAIQNRGTLAGSVANASPAGDPLPILLARDAEIEVQSVRGARRIAATRFFVSYRKTALAPDELITAIRIPWRRPHERVFWRKVGTRRAQSIAKMVLAAKCIVESDTVYSVAIGVGCAAPTPIRVPKTEALLSGRPLSHALVEDARASLAEEIAPIDDVRSTATYRRRVAGNVLASFVTSLSRA